MVGLNSDGASMPATVLSAIGADSSPRSASMIYLIRCPTLISLSTRNFRLRHPLVSCP